MMDTILTISPSLLNQVRNDNYCNRWKISSPDIYAEEKR